KCSPLRCLYGTCESRTPYALGLQARLSRRRIARLIVWRAGFWAGTVRMSSALQAWQRAANRERSIKTCFIIARGRRDASCSNVTHYQGRILKRRLFTILRSYVLTTTLARRTLTAWSRHSQLSSQLRRQAQHICLRVGLRALLTWAKVSKQRRVGRHRAFT
ncbi:unnamed protein product, partial [Sphacelaria rigidula]